MGPFLKLKLSFQIELIFIEVKYNFDHSILASRQREQAEFLSIQRFLEGEYVSTNECKSTVV